MLKSNAALLKSWPALASAFAAVVLLLVLFQSESLRNQIPTHISAVHTTTPQGPRPKLAIATFLTGQPGGEHYFNLTKLLAYQMLHDKPTRLTNPDISFVVLCGTMLSEDKRAAISKLGATVLPVDDVQLPSWMERHGGSWSEQFTKLRIFEQTQYDRILYLDSDFLLLHPLDAIFTEPIIRHLPPLLHGDGFAAELKQDEAPYPPQWLFAARPEMGGIGGFHHPVPPLTQPYANAGFFVTAPDTKLFTHLMTVMHIQNRYASNMMEQDLLNYVFRRGGPMPWRELDWRWSANFVNEEDVAFGVRALHGKFWQEGPEEARTTWAVKMEEMVALEARL